VAGRYLNNKNAEELLGVYTSQIKNVQRQLRESKDPTDRFILEAMEFGDDMSRIGALEDFYRIVPSAKAESKNGRMKRKLEQEREDKRKLAIAGEVNNTINVNGTNYVIEDYLRNPSLINENTPIEVLREKQRLYPEGVNLVKIPNAKKRSEASLFALAMNELENRDVVDREVMPNLPPYMDLSYESRKMSDGLRNALENQYLLDKRSPLNNLRNAGMHGESAERSAEPGDAFKEIQSVMIGDMVRGFNPVTGSPYGPAYVEDGVLVRDQVDGGHVYEHATHSDLAHKASNIIAELGQENKIKQPRGQGKIFTDKQAFFNTVNTALSEGNDLSNLKHNLMSVASERPELRDRVLELLTRIQKVEQMPVSGRGSRAAAENAGWINL